MVRQFSHLDERQIKGIVKAVLLGESKSSVARRYGIDRSTVIYHYKKYESMPRSQVVALVTPICEKCSCVSLKCPQCGKYADNIKSDEYQEIYRLRQRVKDLEFQLKRYVETDIITSTFMSSPIVGVTS